MPHPHSLTPPLSPLLIRRVACERLLQKFLFKFHFGLRSLVTNSVAVSATSVQREFRLKMLKSFFISFLLSMPQKLNWDLSSFASLNKFISILAWHLVAGQPLLACLSPVGKQDSGQRASLDVCVTHKASRKMFAKCWPINYLDSYFAG